ncbi:MAG: hypothetical protein GXO70_06405 [Acidobacteria bacterium]|nr:hypothetical protein [Acidobacteriota bacterium]
MSGVAMACLGQVEVRGGKGRGSFTVEDAEKKGLELNAKARRQREGAKGRGKIEKKYE